MKKRFRLFAAASAAVLVAAACGSDEGDTGGAGGTTSEGPAVISTIGETEGELNLIAWVGYTEDGTTEGYEAYDWVTPFEDATGCQTSVKYADSSDEMFNLMTQQAGAYDGVSASGDSSNRLIASGAVLSGRPRALPRLRECDRPAAARDRHEQQPLRGRRRRVRDPVHVRAELPHVQHR